MLNVRLFYLQNDVISFYQAEVDNLDFTVADGPEAQINSWVENKTENRIPSVLQPGVLSGNTLLVLVNSIFFNGTWASPFKNALTRKGDFYRPDGSSVQVDFMNQIHRYSLRKSYMDSDIIRIPFVNRRFALYIALPKSESALSTLEGGITGENLSDEAFFHGYQDTFVNLTIPKFKLSSNMVLNNVLIDMGMSEAFSSAANFSGITREPAKMSYVIQKALIEVQESGTVAAAATAIIMERTSANSLPLNPYNFFANRSFVFFLREDRLQLILFQGKFADPKTKEINFP
uniref:Serpin domain-containing protein n=1 Tax=Biomphalaria glabrata TaxID=6526 RepID=A0A2C9K3E8_BIOGL